MKTFIKSISLTKVVVVIGAVAAGWAGLRELIPEPMFNQVSVILASAAATVTFLMNSKKAE